MRRWPLILALLLLAGCEQLPVMPVVDRPSPAASSPAASSPDPGYGICHYRTLPGESDPGVVLPDPNCTPGDWNQGLTLVQACAKEGPRPNLARVKLKLLVAYGQARNYAAAERIKDRYELDHLAMRKFGGSDDKPQTTVAGINLPANLWPEPKPPPNQKDGLEFYLADHNCRPGVYPDALNRDQQRMSTNWVEFWHSIGSPVPSPGRGEP